MSEYQKELFDRFKEKKPKLKRFTEKIPKRNQLYVRAPLENIVIVAIVFILALVVAFALGIESGKSKATQSEKRKTQSEELSSAGETEQYVRTIAQSPKEATKTRGPYTLQLISYKEKPLAEKEKNNLLMKRKDAFIIPSGSWFQVCVGSYANKEEAREDMRNFSGRYKGCFIKKIR